MVLPEIKPFDPAQEVEQQVESVDPEQAFLQLQLLQVMGLASKFISRSGEQDRRRNWRSRKDPTEPIAHTKRPDSRIRRRHNQDTESHRETIFDSLRFKQSRTAVAINQEIEAYFMEQAQGGEQEFTLVDPIHRGSGHIEVFNSGQITPAKGNDLNKRSFSPEEVAPKLTRKEKRALRYALVSEELTVHDWRRLSNIQNFGKDNNDVRIQSPVLEGKRK